jgi:hypothetical protein
MILVRLTYFSRNLLDRCYGSRLDAGLAEMTAASIANNRRDGITGALICDRRWFAQALEGAESKLSATFERILRDRRHCDVSLVTMQAVAERRYADFAMVTHLHGADNDDLFRHYAEDEVFDPRQMRADRLCDLIEEVVRRGPTGGESWTTRTNTSAA